MKTPSHSHIFRKLTVFLLCLMVLALIPLTPQTSEAGIKMTPRRADLCRQIWPNWDGGEITARYKTWFCTSCRKTAEIDAHIFRSGAPDCPNCSKPKGYGVSTKKGTMRPSLGEDFDKKRGSKVKDEDIIDHVLALIAAGKTGDTWKCPTCNKDNLNHMVINGKITETSTCTGCGTPQPGSTDPDFSKVEMNDDFELNESPFPEEVREVIVKHTQPPSKRTQRPNPYPNQSVPVVTAWDWKAAITFIGQIAKIAISDQYRKKTIAAGTVVLSSAVGIFAKTTLPDRPIKGSITKVHWTHTSRLEEFRPLLISLPEYATKDLPKETIMPRNGTGERAGYEVLGCTHSVNTPFPLCDVRTYAWQESQDPNQKHSEKISGMKTPPSQNVTSSFKIAPNARVMSRTSYFVEIEFNDEGQPRKLTWSPTSYKELKQYSIGQNVVFELSPIKTLQKKTLEIEP